MHYGSFVFRWHVHATLACLYSVWKFRVVFGLRLDSSLWLFYGCRQGTFFNLIFLKIKIAFGGRNAMGLNLLKSIGAKYFCTYTAWTPYKARNFPRILMQLQRKFSDNVDMVVRTHCLCISLYYVTFEYFKVFARCLNLDDHLMILCENCFPDNRK